MKSPCLPDFEPPCGVSHEEQEHYLLGLLTSQLSLARAICSDSPFAAVLQKRLIVLQRIFFAIASKYHSKESVRNVSDTEAGEDGPQKKPVLTESTASGTQALIEMGVKTGVSLVFSLLRQNWQLSQQHGSISLGNDVLQTALEVTRSLPSLSLANENKIPSLGLSTLNQVTSFLKNVSLPQSGVDVGGKRLALELVLALATQRGSLRYSMGTGRGSGTFFG